MQQLTREAIPISVHCRKQARSRLCTVFSLVQGQWRAGCHRVQVRLRDKSLFRSRVAPPCPSSPLPPRFSLLASRLSLHASQTADRVASGMEPLIRAVLAKLIGELDAAQIDVIANGVQVEPDGAWEIQFRHPER